MNSKQIEPFSFSTIENFDKHISSQILGYDILDLITKRLVRLFLEDDTNVYDIGCSTGRLLNELNEAYSSDKADVVKRITYYGIENNPNFTKDLVSTANVQYLSTDLKQDFTFNNASAVISIFTLQFLPIHLRAKIIKSIYNGLNKGGAFIWSEKVYSESPKIQNYLTMQHFDIKRDRYSATEILKDEESLRDIMKPLTLEENIALLEEAGFKQIEVFWRVNNFLGILCIK